MEAWGRETSRVGPIVPRDDLKGHGAAALIVNSRGEYLMQKRDDTPEIWFPGHWGLFGGGVDPGEGAAEALRRELDEELEFRPDSISYVSQVVFDLGDTRGGLRCRYFFEAPIDEAQSEALVLHEGEGMRFFAYEALQRESAVVPYDVFGILLHRSRSELVRARNIP